MKLFKDVLEQMHDEFNSAEEYLNLAEKFRSQGYEQIAETLYNIGCEELNHYTREHDIIVALKRSYDKSIPQSMLDIWEYEHGNYIEDLTELKWKYQQYKR